MIDANGVLVKWYLGELGGHALFAQLAASSEPDAAIKWAALAQVEQRVGSRLAEVLCGRGLMVDEPDDVQSRAHERCAALRGRSWSETMEWLKFIAGAALREMEVEASQLPADLFEIGRLVVRHEEALIEFAALELRGEAADSLAGIQRFLMDA